MSSSTPMPCASAAPVGLLLALALLSMPGETSAHAGLHITLRVSEPARDAQLSVAPTRIALWFTGMPQLPFSRIRLTGPAGDVALTPVAADTGNGMYARIAAPLGPGAYVISWQTGAPDGHILRGEIPFRVIASRDGARGAPDPAASDTRTQSTPPGTPERPVALQQNEYRSVRWVEFVALLTVLGVLGFRHGVLPPLAARGVPTADASARARRLGMTVLIPYAAAAVVRLYTEARAIHGTDLTLASADLIGFLSSTIWGVGWISGAVGALLLFVGWKVSSRSVTIGTPLALTGAIGMVISPALSGHAAGSSPFVLSVTLDMIHVSAAGLWLGGLLLVLIAGIPAMRRLADGNSDAAVSALVNSFHPLALVCAPLVVLAGIGTSWIRLGRLEAIVDTPYGRTLLFKVALVAVVAGMGAYNAVRARRALGTPDSTRRFRKTAAAELLFAALVLAATTALVVTPPPQTPPAP